MSPGLDRLLAIRRLSRNVLWHFVGVALPFLVAVWAIPLLIEGLGKERFGLLAIVWAGVGYFSLFDLGLGRAMTKLVADRLGADRQDELGALVRTGLRLMLALGAAGALILAAITPWLVEKLLTISPDLHGEAIASFWILAATLPFAVSSAGLVGVMEAHQDFRAIAAVRIPLGLANFLGPLVAMTVSPSLTASTATLAAAKVLAWAAYRRSCHRTLAHRPDTLFNIAAARSLIAYGSWIAVSNTAGPLMMSLDRFVVGSVAGMTAVAYYVTPFEIVSRFAVVAAAFGGVLFPAVATATAAADPRTDKIFRVALRAVLLAMFVPCSLAILLGPEALAHWLGPDFEAQSGSILRVLAFGVFINGVAHLPLAALQSTGRPDLTAKLHVAELPLYAAGLVWATAHFGITGTAAAWTARAIVDAVALFLLALRSLPTLRATLRQAALSLSAGSLLLGLLAIPGDWPVRLGIAGGILVTGGAMLIRSWQRSQGEAAHELSQERTGTQS